METVGHEVRKGKQASLGRKVRRMLRTEGGKKLPQRGFHLPRNKTGQPEWFKQIQLQAEFKRVLSRIPLQALDLTEVVAESLLEAGYRSVWKLSQADYADLLGLKGIGPATLKKLRAQLVKRAVPVTWTAE